MSGISSEEKVIRARFEARLKEWWGDAEPVDASVDELMIDLGYTLKPVPLSRIDPVAYQMTRREYHRAYQARKRERLRQARLAEEMAAAEASAAVEDALAGRMLAGAHQQRSAG